MCLENDNLTDYHTCSYRSRHRAVLHSEISNTVAVALPWFIFVSSWSSRVVDYSHPVVSMHGVAALGSERIGLIHFGHVVWRTLLVMAKAKPHVVFGW